MVKKRCRVSSGKRKGQFKKCPSKKRKGKANKGSCRKGSKRRKCTNIGAAAKWAKAHGRTAAQAWRIAKNNGWKKGKNMSVKPYLKLKKGK